MTVGNNFEDHTFPMLLFVVCFKFISAFHTYIHNQAKHMWLTVTVKQKKKKKNNMTHRFVTNENGQQIVCRN